jgi:hypothetical protein
MGNRRLEHHRFHFSITPPIVLKAIVVKIRKQHAGIRVIQSLGVGITTT